jgi:hypothetical protein
MKMIRILKIYVLVGYEKDKDTYKIKITLVTNNTGYKN